MVIGLRKPKIFSKNPWECKKYEGMNWVEDAQGIKWVGEAQDVIWTDPAGILGNMD